MVNIVEFLPGNTMRVNAVILVHHNHSFALVLTASIHRRFVTTVASLHLLPCSRFLVDLLPWKEKQRHSVHSGSLFFPFIYVYIQHKFNVSHCPLTDISAKVSPKMAMDTLSGETKWLASSLSPAMYNSPKPEAGINASAVMQYLLSPYSLKGLLLLATERHTLPFLLRNGKPLMHQKHRWFPSKPTPRNKRVSLTYMHIIVDCCLAHEQLLTHINHS